MPHEGPLAKTTCKLCRVSEATVRFTDDLRTLDVVCASCGAFRMDNPPHDLLLDALTGGQRLELLTWIRAQHAGGEPSPLVTAEHLRLVMTGHSLSATEREADAHERH